MKKIVLIKVKMLPYREYRRLARILKIRLGADFDSTRGILYVLEEGYKKIDRLFSYTTEYGILPPSIIGSYDPDAHLIYIAPQTYDDAYEGDSFALYTIVHEISHWALLSVFHVKPEFVLLELPVSYSTTTDAEFYADMLSVHLMMPGSVFSGKKNLRTLLTKGKKRGMYTMSLIIFKNRRCCRAVGFKYPQSLHKAKKTA